METVLVEALKSLSPISILLIGVVVFMWRELSREREARIAAGTAALELGHAMTVSMDKLTDALNRKA